MAAATRRSYLRRAPRTEAVLYACTQSGALNSSPRRHSRVTLGQVSGLLISLLTVVSCSDGASNPPPVSTIVSLSIISGDGQVAEVGTELSVPLIVVAKDHSGLPVEGIDVRFQGSGEALRTAARTNREGHAYAYWKLGTQAGDQSMLVTAPNAPAPVTFRAAALAGPPASITMLSSANITGTPGTQLDTLAVGITDRFSNAVISVEVSWSVQQGGGSVQPVETISDLKGRARAIWTLGPALGTQRLVITAGAATRQVTATAGPIFAATQVVAGSDHSCALIVDGTAFCWGSNWTGQLGRGSIDRQANPYPLVITGHKFKSLAAGGVHTCGLALDGTAYCWGDNRAGQLGIPGTEPVPSPARVAGVPAFVALTAGWFHTCGLTSTGQMFCWGDNSLGQLGWGTDRSATAPVYSFNNHKPGVVAGSLHVTSISASPSATSTCAVADGIVYCWGESVEGVLGTEVQQRCRLSAVNEVTYELEEFDILCSSAPVQVATRAAATSVMLERYGACAILVTAELECWGYRRPPTIIAPEKVANAWILWSSVCAESDLGQITCRWLTPPYNTLNPFGVTAPLVKIHDSGRHTCGIAKTSAVYCWGTNYDGALGDGTTTHRTYPVPVVSPP